jgi:diacylglycerol kinase family enzyme
VVRNFWAAKTYPFVLESGRDSLQLEAFFISIANSNQFGNHFTIAPKASLNDGLLDVVVMTRQSKLSVVFQTLKQISGFNEVQNVDIVDEQSSLIYFQTDKLKIVNEEEAPLHIDGDPVETEKEMQFEIIRDAFLLIYG